MADLQVDWSHDLCYSYAHDPCSHLWLKDFSCKLLGYAEFLGIGRLLWAYLFNHLNGSHGDAQSYFYP